MPTYNGTGGNDNASYGGTTADDMYGGAGNDTLNAGGGDDSVWGGTGHDVLTGAAGRDSLWGEDGNDQLFGGANDDTLEGNLGQDTLNGGTGADKLFGGDGVDIVSYSSATGGVSVDLASETATGADGSDEVKEFENIQGSAHADTLRGDGNDNFVDAGSGNDTVDGRAGNDSITAGAGNDSLIGDSGNDTISGGADADTISGGTGNDVLSGDAGNDRLTTGSGIDRIALSDGGGSDIVTDFSLADSNGDGTFDDQIDVSALDDGNGGPVRTWNTQITDDGLGNARLVFPGGETLTLLGVTPAQMRAPGALFKAGIPCFTTGTLILTPKGEVPIENLRAGDLVCTRDNGPQPLLWRALRRLGPADLAAQPDLRPVRIAPGALGNTRPVLVSPQHGLVVRLSDGGGTERLVRAIHLARLDGGGARIARGTRAVTYVHLVFASHQVVLTHSMASESFYPGTQALRSLGPGPLAEFARLFPGLSATAARADSPGPYGPTARPLARFRQLPPHLRDLRPA